MVESPTSAELTRYTKSAFFPAKRYIGDAQCWVVRLPPRPQMPDLPEGFIETNTWELKYDSKRIPTMSFKILLTDCLNFSYLVADEELARYLWPIICPTEFTKR